MTQEPKKDNTILIVVAIIGLVGTIIAATIGAVTTYNVEKMRQEAELTRIALVSNSQTNTSIPPKSISVPFELIGVWKSDNVHAPDNSWNIPYSMYFQFTNTKQNVYHGTDTFNSNRPTDVSDIVYLNINDSTFIKKFIDIPDHPEFLGKFQKWTWRFDNGNVLFTVYKTMDSQDLALNDGTITTLVTGVKVQQP
ncbi:hypothetical protein JZU46_06655 [bacterium]|jgi:hypothetical protein|nr:hypothetical protein [bacterium]